jgi:hypothetical protein
VNVITQDGIEVVWLSGSGRQAAGSSQSKLNINKQKAIQLWVKSLESI